MGVGDTSSNSTAQRTEVSPQRRMISRSTREVTGGLERSRVLCVPAEKEGTNPAEVLPVRQGGGRWGFHTCGKRGRAERGSTWYTSMEPTIEESVKQT